MTKKSSRIRSAALGPTTALAACLALFPMQSAQACATCGCTLSTDGATGFSTQAGWRVALQYDYVNQNRLRHGSGSASGVPEGNELEHRTRNDYLTTTLAYAPNARWNVRLVLPYVVRNHSTYGEFDPSAEQNLTKSHSSSLGDIQLIGAYQGFLPTHNLGVEFGVKLPTGRSGDSVKFSQGPDAGQPLDASLQPGTGSTDLIVGAYYYQALSQDIDGFASVRFQSAVSSRFDYRPGNQTGLSAGLRYLGLADWVPQLQVNLSHRGRDRGANADVDNSAGSYAYLSPGLTYLAAGGTQVFGFVQLPVYRELDGWQLAPRWTASLGISHAF